MSEKCGMRFDFIIGNPPYQVDNPRNSRLEPLYDAFVDQSMKAARMAELITPARFLFHAGQTPSAWNRKMLNDRHVKLMHYQPDAYAIFPQAEIKGGVAILYFDRDRAFKPIGDFTLYEELNSIIHKIGRINPIPFSSIVSKRGMYRFSEKFFSDDPRRKDRIPQGTGNMLTSRIFEVFPEVFQEQRGEDLAPVYGRVGNKRIFRHLHKTYLIDNDFLRSWNVIVPEANYRGDFGEPLSSPEILKPGEAHTDTFLSLGRFQSQKEALNCLKFIRGKFARAMLGILKTTQHNPRRAWKLVPLEDFTAASDIDWSGSMDETDRQFYEKYGLEEKEIQFIESHVQGMD